MMFDAKTINWISEDSHMVFNQRYSDESKKHFTDQFRQFPNLAGHIFVATSGTSQKPKWVAASKKAFLISAESVNRFLTLTSKDSWVNPLPHFHVGALGIYARAYLTGSKVYDFTNRWSAAQFCEYVKEVKGSIASLVPTQVYDLVTQELTSPSCLKYLFVGGGALSPALYQKAQNLGWPLLPTFGMTECVSQVATATLHDPALKILPHVSLKISEKNLLMIKSEALLTGYIENLNGKFFLKDPKNEGWYTTEDMGIIEGIHLKILGRIGNIQKVGGEKVSQQKLEEILQEILLEKKLPLEAFVKLTPDERLGFAVHLIISEKISSFSEKIKKAFDETVLPYERIRKVEIIQQIPRNQLGKISLKDL